MPYPILGWALQILILTTGIYIFLRFLRRTRGGGLIRGLVVALLFGVVGLWGLSKLLGLAELEHIVQSVTGFVVVIFAILFQPELRRGIAQLGEHPLLGRLLDKRRPETVSEVAQAIGNLARRRQGALVAFEREMPLDSYIENGVEVDAAARHILIESIFQPGGSLHDGAVVVRKDRVAAALCLFPLTENVEISKRMGTRHRAALGLTDGSDAVTVAVSEETGEVTICRHGSMRRSVPLDDVEEALREALESDEEAQAAAASEGGDDALTFVRELVTHDAPRKLAALALATALFFVAHNEISSSREYGLRVSSCGPDTIARAAPGELLVQLPTEDDRLIAPRPGEILRVRLSGRDDTVAKLGAELGAVVKLDPSWQGKSELEVRRLAFGPGQGPRRLGLRVDWVGQPPVLDFRPYGHREIVLGPRHVQIETDALSGPYAARPESVSFEPARVTVSGPLEVVREIDEGRLDFGLEPAALAADVSADWSARLPLRRELSERGLVLEGPGTVRVSLPVRPVETSLDPVEKPIALVSLLPQSLAELARYQIAPEESTARLRLTCTGILSGVSPEGSAPSPAEKALRALVEKDLVVFADVGERDPESNAVVVHWSWRSDWREVLSSELGPIDPAAWIDVKLETSASVLLIARGSDGNMRDERENQ